MSADAGAEKAERRWPGMRARMARRRKSGAGPFSAVEVPAPLPVPGAVAMIDLWVYAPGR